jgi:hypothetical protein
MISWSRLVPLARVVLVASLAILALSSSALGADDVTAETYLDFRGRSIEQGLTFGDRGGQYIRAEPEGLRITLPKNEVSPPRVGLNLTTTIVADFEVTTGFEILQAEEPKEPGFGVGILLAVNKNARLGWFAQPEGRRVILWDRWSKTEKRALDGGDVRIQDNAGRLRLKRTGKTLHYLWSRQPTGDDFDEVHQCEYPEEVTSVRLIAETNREARNLDVRVLDLRIRGGGVSAAGLGEDPARTWLWMALLTLLLIFFLAGWMYVRQNRQTHQQKSPVP